MPEVTTDIDIDAIDMHEIEKRAHRMRAEMARDLTVALGRAIAKPFTLLGRKKPVAA
ncbi:hypothetical protein OU789_07480 [Halocynthiibacter sp. C4]|uniref:RSP_7527 family protein n=1 Tax=Halocynthiibacter sp. C4 TaxID=2992758 RepID=UPI00237A0BE3|nr:hypothetical protein [Halocynthiibacter sp. C4]MDE0589760.1 hypothetical protein [Halocynthiibacter sp. C4]